LVVEELDDTTIYVKYYIKYQEVGAASSESQVDDVANLRYAIYGLAAQIGSENSYNTIGNNGGILATSLGVATYGIPFTFSAYILNANQGYYVDGYYKGTRVFRESTTLLTINKVYRIHIYLNPSTTLYQLQKTVYTQPLVLDEIRIIPVFSASAFPAPNLPWTNVGADNFTFTATQFRGSVSTTGTKTFEASTPISLTTGFLFHLNWSWFRESATWQAGTTTLRIDFYLSTSLVQSISYAHSLGTGSTLTEYQFENVELVSDVDEIRFYVETPGVSSGSANFVIAPTLRVYKGSEISEVSMDVYELCQNTVELQWKNSEGGDQCYPFQYNQEYTYHYSDRKAKRLTLFANNLTLSQWEAIQGLNTLGDLYKTPIVEMTTSLNRTSSTMGQSVYVLNSDGTKTGVNVIGQPNTTFTKRRKHSAFVTIEYPELFLQ
jgi:hypothetical protein